MSYGFKLSMLGYANIITHPHNVAIAQILRGYFSLYYISSTCYFTICAAFLKLK